MTKKFNDSMALRLIKGTYSDSWHLEASEVTFLLDLYVKEWNASCKHILSSYYTIDRPKVIDGIISAFKKHKDEHEVAALLGLTRELLYPNVLNDLGSEGKSKFDSYSNDQFPYIPSYFTELFSKGSRHIHPEFLKGTEFIDIGCGIGDKVILFHLLSGMNSTGVEYDFYTYRIACTVANYFPTKAQYKLRFIHEDAFKMSYEKYDRIYTYRPLKNTERLKEFYRHILSSIKPGTIWLEYGGGECLAIIGKEFNLYPLTEGNIFYFIKK